MRYTDEGHFKTENGYDVSGRWYPRVTKILDIKSKPGLDIFFKEMGSFEAAEAVKSRSAEEGTLVHTALQQRLAGTNFDVPESIRPAVAAFDEFQERAQITFYPEFFEKRIWSERHRYAGTVDALASVGGKFGVLDIKTSAGFYPEYNLQTAAYVSALQEFSVRRTLGLPQEVATRWILKVDQSAECDRCGAFLRTKGGRNKIRVRVGSDTTPCGDSEHTWGKVKGTVALKEFPYLYGDMKAFMAAKILWEWEYGWWLRKIGYSGNNS